MGDSALPAGWKVPELTHGGSVEGRLLRVARSGLLSRFMSTLSDPETAETEALRRVLDASKGTDFGRRHGLARVNTIREYREAVPIRTHADHADDLARVSKGHGSTLVADPVRSLLITSGTTGSPKLLPVTDAWRREVAEAQALWVLAMVIEQPQIARGFLLASVGKPVEGRIGALAYGSNTGRMYAEQPWLVRSRTAVPAEVADIPDPEVRTYVALRLALARDIRSWTTANPSTVLAWCRALQANADDLQRDLRDGGLSGPARALDPWLRAKLGPWCFRARWPADPRPAAFWPNLQSINCWKGGAAKFFIERFPDALGRRVAVREVGVSASEGFFAVALHSSWDGGVAWSLGHLLEFVPVAGGPAIGIAELGRGEYRLVISTTAGLYRYDMDDIVECVGHWERLPLLVFRRKGADVLNVTGEKVASGQASEAARAALHGVDVRGFSVGVRMDEKPTYVLAVEADRLPDGAASRFDAELRRLNVEYDSKRSTDRLGMPIAVQARAGVYAELRAERLRAGAAEGQVKDRIVVDAEGLRRLIGG